MGLFCDRCETRKGVGGAHISLGRGNVTNNVMDRDPDLCADCLRDLKATIASFLKPAAREGE